MGDLTPCNSGNAVEEMNRNHLSELSIPVYTSKKKYYMNSCSYEKEFIHLRGEVLSLQKNEKQYNNSCFPETTLCSGIMKKDIALIL